MGSKKGTPRKIGLIRGVSQKEEKGGKLLKPTCGSAKIQLTHVLGSTVLEPALAVDLLDHLCVKQ